MLDPLGQAIASGSLRVILPLLPIVVLAAAALRPLTLAAAAIDKRIIAPVEDTDRRARLQTWRKAAKSTAQVVIAAAAGILGLMVESPHRAILQPANAVAARAYENHAV
jgi:hypothetical protein